MRTLISFLQILLVALLPFGTSDMESTSRALELEQALRDLVAYMRTLPVVPANYEAIKKAETALASNRNISL